MQFPLFRGSRHKHNDRLRRRHWAERFMTKLALHFHHLIKIYYRLAAYQASTFTAFHKLSPLFFFKNTIYSSFVQRQQELRQNILNFLKISLDFSKLKSHNNSKCDDRKIVRQTRNYRELPGGERRQYTV